MQVDLLVKMTTPKLYDNYPALVIDRSVIARNFQIIIIMMIVIYIYMQIKVRVVASQQPSHHKHIVQVLILNLKEKKN